MTLQQRIAQLERTRCCGKPKYYNSFEDFPIPGVENTLYVDETTGSIYIWNGDGYLVSGGEEPLFLFQVGIPLASHIHWAPLTANQAKYLIQNTTGLLPVADEGQPFVVITTETNGVPGDEHIHELTVFFDYLNHTFIVTNISNNDLYNHEAHLVGTAGGGGGIPYEPLGEYSTHEEAGLDGGLTPGSFYVLTVTNLEGVPSAGQLGPFYRKF